MPDSNNQNPQSLVEQFRVKRNLIIDEVVGSLVPKVASQEGVSNDTAEIIISEQYLPYINYIVSKELNRLSILDEVLTNLDYKEGIINTLAESSQKLAAKMSKDELKELSPATTPTEGKLSQEAKQSIEEINSEGKKIDRKISSLASDIKNKVDNSPSYKANYDLNPNDKDDEAEILRRAKAPKGTPLAEDELNKAQEQLDLQAREEYDSRLNNNSYDSSKRLSKAKENIDKAKQYKNNFDKTGRETAKPSDTGNPAKGFYAKSPNANPNLAQKAAQKIEDKATSTLPGLGSTRPIESQPDSDGVGKGKMKSGGFYNSKGEYVSYKGKPIFKGIDGTSNRDVAATLARGGKNLIRGAGNITEAAALNVQKLGSKAISKGEELENSGKTETGEDKEGLGNAAKRFIGKDLKNTGKDIAKAGEALKKAGAQLKSRAAQAAARVLIALMPWIAGILAVMLVISVVCVVIIIIICKSIEGVPFGAGDTLAGIAGVPEEIRGFCKGLGFQTCDNNSSGTTVSGTPCTNESITINGLQMPDVAWLPDNENLYYFMLATRAQEVGGLGWDNTTAGNSDRDSCGPYQQRINELFPGGAKSAAAKNIMGEVKYNQVFKGAPSSSESYGEDAVTKAEALSFCKLLISTTGPAFFDQMFVQRIKDRGMYDKVLAGGDPSIYPQMVYDVQVGQPKYEKIISTVTNAKKDKLFDKKKQKCGLGNKTSFYQKQTGDSNNFAYKPKNTITFSFAIVSNVENITDKENNAAANDNYNILNSIFGIDNVLAQSASGISAERKQLADLMKSGKISAQSGDDISNVENGTYADNLVLLMLKLYNSGMTFRTGSRNYRPPAGTSQHTIGQAMDFVAFQKGDTFSYDQAKFVDKVNVDSSALAVVTEAVNIMKASGAVKGSQLIGPDSMKAKGLVPMGTSDVVDGDGNVIGTHEDHIHVGVNPSAKVDSTGVDGKNASSNSGSTSGNCGNSSTSGATTGYNGDAKVDKSFVQIMKDAAARGGFGASTCYKTVWFMGLQPNYNSNPDSPWGKVFPALDKATAESGLSQESAIHFAMTLNKPGVADKVGVRNLKNEGVGDPNDSRVPPGAIIVISNEYPGVSSVHGDINVKSDDGRFLNFGDMTSWMKTIEPKYILGIYVPK